MRSRSSGDGVYQKGMGAIRSSGGLLERAGKALAILIILALGAAASGQNKAWHQLMSTNAGPETMPGPRFGQASLVMNTEKLYWEFGGQVSHGPRG